MNTTPHVPAENPILFQHYRDLPAAMFAESMPAPSSAPSLLKLNQTLLDQLGIDASWFSSKPGLSVMSGNSINEANHPIALAYSGHQFGN